MTQHYEAPASTDPTGLSAPVRVVLVMAGTISLVLGVIGVLVPILPTTPFLLVSAACYARASTRLYEWLLARPTLGPIIVAWRRSRSLPPGIKARAMVMVAITFTLSIVLVDEVVLRAGLVMTGIILTVFLYRIPTAQIKTGSVAMAPTPPPEET